MSYNGSGTFNINSTGQPVVTGTAISSTVFNTFTADIGTGLSTALTKDGQTVATVRIPFAAGINSGLVTDATSTTTGSIITAGGVGVAKALFVGTTANIAGTTTLAGVTATSITDSGLTSGRVTFASTAGLLADAAALAWDGTSLSATKFAGALNGTVGATTPSTGAFTTGTFSSTLAVTGITTVAAGSAALPAIVSTTGTADTGLWFPAADTVCVSTAGVERMRIDSSGNVGIGISSPSKKLEIYASAVSLQIESVVRNDMSGAGVAAIGFNVSSSLAVETTSTKAGIGLVRSAAFGGGSLCFYNNNSGAAGDFTTADEQMRIDSSGNVGIGTSSPAQKLNVVGSMLLSGQSTADQFILVGSGRSGNGYSYVDLVGDTTYSSYGLRLIRNNTGANTSSSIQHRGTGALELYTSEAAPITLSTSSTERLRITSAGRVGIGTGATVNYALEVSTDSAGKPGVGGLWTVVSDERIKSDIVPANLDRCYEIVKSVPLKHFGFAPGVYTDDQIQDKHNLGWIAQDVQKVFKNAVSVKPFTLKTDIPDGTEEYEEQDFTLESVKKTETSIQVINGKAVQVSKVVTSENKVFLFDTVDVVDEAGAAVMVDDKPLTYQMPRMITKTRPKVRHDVIEDCLDFNGGQMLAALYGAVQALMEKVETIENRLTLLEAK